MDSKESNTKSSLYQQIVLIDQPATLAMNMCQPAPKFFFESPSCIQVFIELYLFQQKSVKELSYNKALLIICCDKNCLHNFFKSKLLK